MKEEIFNKYVTEVADIFKIEEEEVFDKSKKRTLSDARHLLYYVCSQRHMRLVTIQSYMNDRGYSVAHQTIMHGIKAAKSRVSEDNDYKLIIKKLKDV
tara:strand:- start:617 stop:910 length:294 start_codon:yes stop_codon:yes gene_type:complete